MSTGQSEMARALDEFHAGLGDEPGRGNAGLRYTLHEEEHRELIDELADKRLGIDVWEPKPDHEVDRAKLARELADVVYLAYGTAHAFDIDLDAALAEIHRAAMSKLDPPCPNPFCDGGMVTCGTWGVNAFRAACRLCGGSGKGERIVRNDGKIMKPSGFVPPNMSGAVR